MPRRKKSEAKKAIAKARGAETWFAVVEKALIASHGKAPLATIYGRIEGHPNTVGREHWQAKVRQVLEQHDVFVRVEKGVWALASKYSAKAVKKFTRLRKKECPKRTEDG